MTLLVSLGYSLGAALLVGAMSFVGVVLLFNKRTTTNAFLLYLLSLSAGGMLGGAFFHLIPEAVEGSASPLMPFVFIVIGFIIFFIIEKVLHRYHQHSDHSDEERLGYINLFADGFHNFIDGIAIFASFAVSIPLGTAVTFAIILHEIPQEIGDFGVLLYAGFSKGKALFFNFMVAMTALVGVVAGYFLVQLEINSEHVLIPLAAGSFIYIAAANLIPEIHKEEKMHRSIISFLVLIAALAIMYVLKVTVE